MPYIIKFILAYYYLDCHSCCVPLDKAYQSDYYDE